MKPLFLALLLTNVLVLIWSTWLAPDNTVHAAAPPASVPRLTLATEAGKGETMASSPAQVPEPNATDAAPASSAPDTTQVAAANTTEASKANDGDLLSNVQRCVSVGPFRDLAETTQASATMRNGGYVPRTRVAEGDVWAGLWVYLGNLPSRAEAQRAMTVLKEKGIADAYIMPSTDGTNEISLGIFSEPDRAQRRAEEAKAMGFTPTVADRTRRGTVYWIDIDLKSTDGIINPADLQSESGRIVRLQVKACPPASAGNG